MEKLIKSNPSVIEKILEGNGIKKESLNLLLKLFKLEKAQKIEIKPFFRNEGYNLNIYLNEHLSQEDIFDYLVKKGIEENEPEKIIRGVFKKFHDAHNIEGCLYIRQFEDKTIETYFYNPY
jgi:hypothetical protein